jgi:hypothetical protein
VDIRQDVMRKLREKALAADVEDHCFLTESAAELANMIVSIDAFEHSAEPAAVLCVMYSLLQPDDALTSFGPNWIAPGLASILRFYRRRISCSAREP